MMEIVHFLLWEYQNPNYLLNKPLTGRCWNPPKNVTPHPKTKKKLQLNRRRYAITVKSNPILASWVTHKLENNNTKVLPQLWRFWAPWQASQPGDPAKGLEIPRESVFESWLKDFHRTWGNRDSTLGVHKLNVVCTKTQGKGAVNSQKPGLDLSVKGCCWTMLNAGVLGLRRRRIQSGSEMRFDRSELLCNKVLLKYKRDRKIF